MKIGLIGLPQTGKKTLFELLTGIDLAKEVHLAQKQVKVGVVKIKDVRFDKLVDLYKPKKNVHAAIELHLLPKVEKETIKSGDFSKSVLEADAICHLVRAFEDESVFHIDGSVDPMRDIENINSELILSDLILIEKRLERLQLEHSKKPNPNYPKEKELLLKLKAQLDNNLPIRLLKFNDEESRILSAYQFLSKKPVIIVLNAGEARINDADLINKINEKYIGQAIFVMQICAKIEDEISKLQTQEEKDEFLKDLGISEPAIDKLTRVLFEALGLISFFTVGEDEVRQWPIKKGLPAHQAAGEIHSDLEKGFIRAEVMKFDDLIHAGSEAKVKELGKFMLKGKEYIVEDGDIISIRFNV